MYKSSRTFKMSDVKPVWQEAIPNNFVPNSRCLKGPRNNVEAPGLSTYSCHALPEQHPPSLPLLKHVLRQPSASATQAVFTSSLTQSSGSTSLNSSVTFRTDFLYSKLIQTTSFWLLSQTWKCCRMHHGSESVVWEPGNLSRGTNLES